MSKKVVREIADKLGVDLSVVPIELLVHGTEVEFKEHANIDPRLNVIGDSIKSAVKIALAHLSESIRYYDELARMEAKLDRYHEKHPTPYIFLD